MIDISLAGLQDPKFPMSWLSHLRKSRPGFDFSVAVSRNMFAVVSRQALGALRKHVSIKHGSIISQLKNSSQGSTIQLFSFHRQKIVARTRFRIAAAYFPSLTCTQSEAIHSLSLDCTLLRLI